MKRFGIVSLIIGLLLASSVFVAAQTEPDTSTLRLIERPYTAVIEVFVVSSEFAAEVPFSGDTSDFDGLCSEPVDLVRRHRWEGLDSVFGHFSGTLFVCVQAEWGVDAEDAPLMTGMRFTDFRGQFSLPDGSTIDHEMTTVWADFDVETGQLTQAISWVTSGGGTGKFEGAALLGTTYCRWYDDEAVMAGVEPRLCVLNSIIRYNPHAGTDQ